VIPDLSALDSVQVSLLCRFKHDEPHTCSGLGCLRWRGNMEHLHELKCQQLSIER